MGRPAQIKEDKTAFATLEQRVTHVSEVTIRKKWKKLPSIKHTATKEIILSARNHARRRRRSAVAEIAIEECVQEVATKLIDRLPRIPFPHTTDEHHFDYEANLHRVNKVEEQLTANIHSINMLRAQIEKEEQLLKQDREEVERLEHSFKSNETYRRKQGKDLHPTAQTLGQDSRHLDLLALDLQAQANGGPEQDFAELFYDLELRPMLQQLQNHLGSMRNNTSGISSIKNSVDHVITDLGTYTLALHHSKDFRDTIAPG